jgi:hypothetical protein
MWSCILWFISFGSEEPAMTKSCLKYRKLMASMRSHYTRYKDGSVTSQTENWTWFHHKATSADQPWKHDMCQRDDWVRTIYLTENHCIQIEDSSRNSQADFETRAWPCESEHWIDPVFADRLSETTTSWYCNRTPPVPRGIFATKLSRVSTMDERWFSSTTREIPCGQHQRFWSLHEWGGILELKRWCFGFVSLSQIFMM